MLRIHGLCSQKFLLFSGKKFANFFTGLRILKEIQAYKSAIKYS